MPWRRECNPLQYSRLGSSLHRGAWRAPVHGVKESDTPEQLAHNEGVTWYGRQESKIVPNIPAFCVLSWYNLSFIVGGTVTMMSYHAHDRISYIANVEKIFRCKINFTPFGIFTSEKREVFSPGVMVNSCSAIQSSASGLNLGLRIEGVLEKKKNLRFFSL